MTNAEIRRQMSAGQTTGETFQGEQFVIERTGIYAPPSEVEFDLSQYMFGFQIIGDEL